MTHIFRHPFSYDPPRLPIASPAPRITGWVVAAVVCIGVVLVMVARVSR